MGSAIATFNHKKIKTLDIGDMIGFMALNEMPTCQVNKYDIISETSGIIAVLAYSDLKIEMRRNPQAVSTNEN